jgi:hypothetical protein
MPVKFVPLQNRTLVDLTFGCVAASLPVLSAFIPSRWNSSIERTDPNTPRSHHAISRGHTKLRSENGLESDRERGGSEENIMRTDVIELTFHNKVDEDWKPEQQAVPSNLRDESRERNGRSDLRRMGSVNRSSDNAWVGQAV